MNRKRKLSTGVAAAVAAGALLTGVAFAESDAMLANDADTDGGGSAIAKLAKATTMTGEAKGDAISAAAKAAHPDVDTDEDNDVDDTGIATTDRDAHGDAVSTLARTTTLTGEAKGDAISALASSKSHRTSH
jgi:hypothetical protein